jgi:pimeloyl-ACP methyl ester carboxylesterase
VTRLASSYTVIAIDLRGNGDSGKPETKSSYAIDCLLEDVFAVADAEKAPSFSL